MTNTFRPFENLAEDDLDGLEGAITRQLDNNEVTDPEHRSLVEGCKAEIARERTLRNP